MGAFSGLGSTLAKGASKALEMGANVLEHTAAVEHIFKRTDEGQIFLEDYKNVYQPTMAQSKEALGKAALARVAADPAKPKIDVGEIHSQAAKISRHELMGPKDGLGVTLAASIEKKHGPLAAQSFSNAVSFLLKDYVDPMAEGRGTLAGPEGLARASKYKVQAPYSSFKKNVVKAGVALNSVAPSFTPKGPIEKAVTNALYQTFSPLIVVPHLATTFNGLFGSDPITFIKGITKPLGQSLAKGIDSYQALVTTGAFAETHMRDIAEWNQFQATGRPSFSGSGAAHLVYKMFHQPGFSTLRDYTLLSGANAGKMTAQQVARDFVKDPTSAKGLWQMKEFGLDPQKVILNKGALDEEDLGRAVYKFVDKHYFLDSSLQRSMLLQSTWAGRILGTYHSYVTRQAKLMARSMALDIRGQGVASTIKNLAIGAVLFPAMGEGIKTIQETYKGEDAIGDLKTDMKNISGKKGVEAALSTYASMLGHVAAFGVYSHVLRGAYTHRLLDTLGGPLLSAADALAEDTTTAVAKSWKSKGRHKQKDWAPVERDLLYDTPGISLLAQVLAHRVLPNAKDNPKKDPLRELYHYMSSDDKPQDKSTEDPNQ